jgi:hypothetical protein
MDHPDVMINRKKNMGVKTFIRMDISEFFIFFFSFTYGLLPIKLEKGFLCIEELVGYSFTTMTGQDLVLILS